MTVQPDARTLTPAAAEPAAAPASPDWLAGAVAALRARLWLVALCAALFGLGAIIWLRGAEYRYTVALRVAAAPTSARETSSLGSLTGLVSLAGGTLEPMPVTPFRLFVEGVYTREVAERIASDPALLHRAFPAEWDSASRRWHPPRSLGSDLATGFYTLVGIPVPAWTPPNAARMQEFIARHVHLAQTPTTPVVTISIDSADRDFAQALVVRLHATVDGWLRERALARTANNIAYLEARLPGITQADHRQALFATLSDQQQRQMMARNPAAYAAERFGPAIASPVPTSPRQLLVLAIALVLGTLVGVMLALLLPRRQLQ